LDSLVDAYHHGQICQQIFFGFLQLLRRVMGIQGLERGWAEHREVTLQGIQGLGKTGKDEPEYRLEKNQREGKTEKQATH